ncbi:hypothetical protein ACFQ8E_18175 [Isoptericola sp. NPDC056573]|uniref:hypothetical protein n=1 Tax=Isoptericola sp. NPDC056573 TaxID=3345868 RepID=UPI00368F1352
MGRQRRYTDEQLAEAVASEFFVIDGELRQYRIPAAVVGGLHAIHVDACARYRLLTLAPAGPAADVS